MSEFMVLITGANGQIGKVLTAKLREKYGNNCVLPTDITEPSDDLGLFEHLDITNRENLIEIVEKYKVNHVYHLAAILSANGEANPSRTWNINMNGLLSILDLGKEKKVDRIFFPSSIAVFGNTTPRINTAQDVPQMPTTVYGISKSAGELWCNYYHEKFGVDVRSVRYPGIISWQSLPGGGTTDYAVEIYHEALKKRSYECFIDENTRLPMMYIDDAMKATMDIMSADVSKIKIRYGYNLSAMSFTPAEVATEIRKHIPEFEISYKPDFRQDIAASWSETIDDSRARTDWGWKPEFDLASMTEDMLKHLSQK